MNSPGFPSHKIIHLRIDIYSWPHIIDSQQQQTQPCEVVMKSVLFALLLALATSAHASTASANHGHHGGGNNGAVGAAAGAFGGSSSASAAGSGASGGNGSSYGDWYLRASPVDNFQPYPESEMRQYQKAAFVPFDGK
jgi:hypothetical protein